MPPVSELAAAVAAHAAQHAEREAVVAELAAARVRDLAHKVPVIERYVPKVNEVPQSGA